MSISAGAEPPTGGNITLDRRLIPTARRPTGPLMVGAARLAKFPVAKPLEAPDEVVARKFNRYSWLLTRLRVNIKGR